MIPRLLLRLRCELSASHRYETRSEFCARGQTVHTPVCDCNKSGDAAEPNRYTEACQDFECRCHDACRCHGLAAVEPPLDEERLARALARWLWQEDWNQLQDGLQNCRAHAAFIAKAYREDSDAHD